MKTKNQTGQNLLELATDSAANEDGISPANDREETTPAGKPAWSPLEVWRTRVKTPSPRTRPEPAQV